MNMSIMDIHLKFLIFITTLITCSQSMAASPIDGWYTQAFGGYAYVPSNVQHSYNNLWLSNVKYNPGFNAGGSLGFKNTPMRYEGEITYLKANLNKFEVNYIKQLGVDGYNDAILGFANVYYDAPGLIPVLQPFVGIGIGYAWVQAIINGTGPLAITDFNATNSVFAYQATAGLTYNFAENYAFTTGYRYISTTNLAALGFRFQTHLINLGAIYRFDGDQYK